METQSVDAPVQFDLLTAFSATTGAGNPAAVVYLTPAQSQLSTAELQGIAENLNQPITNFVSIPSHYDANSPLFGIRWFTPKSEVTLCGHGTMATGGALRNRPDLLSSQAKAVKFKTLSGVIIQASKVNGGEHMEIELPAVGLVALSTDDDAKVRNVLKRAFKNDDLDIVYIAAGAPPMSQYLMIQLGDQEQLRTYSVDVEIMRETNFLINVITTRGGMPGKYFVSRMFAPAAGIDEDQVCGSTHALMTPYWSRKDGLKTNEIIEVGQVSRRGGELRAVWDDDRAIVKLSGHVTRIGGGNLFI